MINKTELVKKALEINLESTGKILKAEFLNNPISLYEAMVEAATCDKELGELRANFKELEANLDGIYRENKDGLLEKVTDKGVLSLVQSDPSYVDGKKAILEKEFELDLIKAKVAAYSQRGSMLFALTQYK